MCQMPTEINITIAKGFLWRTCTLNLSVNKIIHDKKCSYKRFCCKCIHILPIPTTWRSPKWPSTSQLKIFWFWQTQDITGIQNKCQHPWMLIIVAINPLPVVQSLFLQLVSLCHTFPHPMFSSAQIYFLDYAYVHV